LYLDYLIGVDSDHVVKFHGSEMLWLIKKNKKLHD